MFSLGEKFGYLMPSTQMLNPLDRFSLFIQRVFPLDFGVLIFLVTFLVLAATSGFQKVGIGIPWIKVLFVVASSLCPPSSDIWWFSTGLPYQTLENKKPFSSGCHGQLGIDFILAGRSTLSFVTTVRHVFVTKVRRLRRKCIFSVPSTSDTSSWFDGQTKSSWDVNIAGWRMSKNTDPSVWLERSRRPVYYDTNRCFVDAHLVQNVVFWSRLLLRHLDFFSFCASRRLHCDFSTFAYCDIGTNPSC